MRAIRSTGEVVDYLKQQNLQLATAESCTAGRIIELLAEVPGSGASLEVGYVVYSLAAKKRVLKVKQATADAFNLTSVEVAIEMVRGAMAASEANVAIACTGVAGPGEMDGIKPGTICFAWGFKERTEQIQKQGQNGTTAAFGRTIHFPGDRQAVIDGAARFALDRIVVFHQKFLNGERA